METLEELKTIIAGKPDGSTHHSMVDEEYLVKGCTYGWMRWSDVSGSWEKFEPCYNIRSLSDIERIIALMEATQGMLQNLAGTPDGYWRNEVKAARKALGYE